MHSFSVGMRMRLTMNPGVSFARTGCLPACSAHSKAAESAASELFSARMISTSGSSGAGLKKCMPITRSGCSVASAMEWIGIAEVFDARIASGAGEAVELGEHLPLRLELLDDRLDHEVAVGQVGELGREGQPAERRVPLLGGRLALLDGAANVVRDRLSGAFTELLADLAPDRLEARPARRPVRCPHPSCPGRRLPPDESRGRC